MDTTKTSCIVMIVIFFFCLLGCHSPADVDDTEPAPTEEPNQEPGEGPEEPPLVENWDLIEITRAEVGTAIMKNCSIWLRLPDL